MEQKKIPSISKINEIKPSPSINYKIEETNSENVKKFFGKIFGKK